VTSLRSHWPRRLTSARYICGPFLAISGRRAGPASRQGCLCAKPFRRPPRALTKPHVAFVDNFRIAPPRCDNAGQASATLPNSDFERPSLLERWRHTRPSGSSEKRPRKTAINRNWLVRLSEGNAFWQLIEVLAVLDRTFLPGKPRRYSRIRSAAVRPGHPYPLIGVIEPTSQLNLSWPPDRRRGAKRRSPPALAESCACSTPLGMVITLFGSIRCLADGEIPNSVRTVCTGQIAGRARPIGEFMLSQKR